MRNVLKLACDLSTELQQDAAEREKWHYILSHLSGYATQEYKGKTIFRRTEKDNPPRKQTVTNKLPGTNKHPGVPSSITQIYPASQIGLGSDPRLLEISRNTVSAVNQWVTTNGESSFFPAAARVGYDPETLLKRLHEMVFKSNGIVANPMHMLENSSIVPNTVDEMLMQSHEGIIRLFPVWPKQRDAQFHDLRAYGAFLISASLRGSRVRHVSLLSEKGRPCVVQNPWPGSRVTLICNGEQAQAQTLTGDVLRFTTSPGDLIQLAPMLP